MEEHEIRESIRKEIDNWKKKTRKKGTFYLYRKDETIVGYGEKAHPGHSYKVIWYEASSGKTKFGVFVDGMSTRYGVATWATLTGTSATGLWQCSNGVINDDELAAMIKIAKGEKDGFEIFDIDQIKDIRI